MGISLLDSGSVTRTFTRCRIMDGSTLRNIVRVKVMDADNVTLRTVATFALPLTVTAPNVSHSEASSIQQATATATPVGGLGPYTYSWTYLSGVAFTVTGEATASPTFTSSGMPPGDVATGFYRCTCNDSSGQTATADLTVTFYNTSPF